MKFVTGCVVITFLLTSLSCWSAEKAALSEAQSQAQAIQIILPGPDLDGQMSIEKALATRRSLREYTGEYLTLQEVGQLLWASQGITSEWGGRTAPSAGALYPLEVYLVAGNVHGLASGVYTYQTRNHALELVKEGDIREQLADAALNQSCVKDGAICIIIAGIYERTTGKYGDRGIRYVHMEAGHAAQNIYLQATALNLGTVTVGAFFDDRVAGVTGMKKNETPLYLLPAGRVSR